MPADPGASPISDEVMTFLRVCFGATVLEGYGMTETSSAMTVTRPDDYTTGRPCGLEDAKFDALQACTKITEACSHSSMALCFWSGHVGAPLPCAEIKLADIPEMNYLTSDKPYPRWLSIANEHISSLLLDVCLKI